MLWDLYMKQILLVFIGGGFGSTLRYIIGKYMNSTETGIPWGTFTANILGSLIIGVILGFAAKNDALSSNQTLLLATGFCGGFTTFSSFTPDIIPPFSPELLRCSTCLPAFLASSV